MKHTASRCSAVCTEKQADNDENHEKSGKEANSFVIGLGMCVLKEVHKLQRN